MLVRALSMDPRIDIVGTAKNGLEAVERARELDPDVITLDIEMPELDGLEALTHIRKHTDARVIMLSSDSDADTVYRALALGAVDFISKPTAGMATSISQLTELLLKKIRTAYRVPPGRSGPAPVDVRTATGARARVGAPDAPAENGAPDVLVALAASTGGPPALERVFSGLTASLSAAFIVVQHLPGGFSASLARRLSGAGPIRVEVAVDGQAIEQGRAYVAPYGRHVTVVHSGEEAWIRLLDAPMRHGVCPAADLLFESVAEQYAQRGVGVVLSGMGADGAMGALAIKRAGGGVVVQDEETSVIWGMPGSTVRCGGASCVVPIQDVAAEVNRAVQTRAGVRSVG
jgi:two-component system chemotaxis response regulator CheB